LVAFGAAETPNRAVVAGLLMQIPYSMEQGIILVEQGIPAQEQGILLAKPEIHRRMRFSVHTGVLTHMFQRNNNGELRM
jgi:hypothetical protein